MCDRCWTKKYSCFFHTGNSRGLCNDYVVPARTLIDSFTSVIKVFIFGYCREFNHWQCSKLDFLFGGRSGSGEPECMQLVKMKDGSCGEWNICKPLQRSPASNMQQCIEPPRCKETPYRTFVSSHTLRPLGPRTGLPN